LSVLLITGIGHAAIVGYRLNVRHYTDPAEPYVYVQTKKGISEVCDIIRKKIHALPDVRNMTVWISLNDPWPLPWIFSRFPHVLYGETHIPEPKADLIFTEDTVDDGKLAGLYWRTRMELRDAREPINAYFKKAVFHKDEVSGYDLIHVTEIKGE
jgi:hypothetical protein